MKRVLSLVLAFMLVFSSILPAFAEEATANSEAGEKLMKYGVIAGTDKGLEEDAPLTRAQMAVILADMYGLKAEATAYAFDAPFSDMVEGAWYVPYVAFAQQKGWMVGDAAGTFRPNDTVKAQELNVMFVKALGYEAEWTTANEDAKELGIDTVAADDSLVLRGEAFVTMVKLLDTPKMDETDTLGTALGLENYVPPTPATPDELEVVSVDALNLIQVEVVFNQEVDVDSAEDADNYEVEDMDIKDAALQADMKTVVLTLTKAAAQQDELDVTVDAVETAEEVALEEVVFEEVAFLDTTIPTVLSAEVVGIDTIKITFSEPMTETSLEVKGNYSVDGGDLYINKVEAMNNNTEANITLYSDLKEGDVTVKVKAAIEDEAGFGVVQDTLTATVVEDEDAPVVVDFKDATTTGVTLIFNEEIEIADDAKANYYHTNSNNPIDEPIVVADDLSSDGKELTLNFTDNELPEGTAYVYVLKESVNDLWDNENAQIMFKIEITLDETAPEVDSVKVKTEEQIQVKFTEAVDSKMAEDEDNYTILDKDGEEVKDIIDDIDYASKTATIDFNDTLSGKYSIVVKNIEDPAENEMATATIEFDVDDLTAPKFEDFTATVYNSTKKDQMIIISFGEEMNAEGNYSVVDPANYTVNGTALTDLVDDYEAEIALTNNGKSVKITCPIDDPDTTKVVEGVDLVPEVDGLVIARVADAAGNYTVDYTGNVTIVNQDVVNIDTVKVTAKDTVEVTFDDLLEDFTAADLMIKDASDNNLDLAKRAISMNSDGNTVVTLTLITDLTADAKVAIGGDTVKAVIAADPTSANKFGETLKPDAEKSAVDKIAAELYTDKKDTHTADVKDYLTFTTAGVITVIFDEEVVISDVVLAGNDFVVKADNDVLVNGVDFKVTGTATSTVPATTDDSVVFVLMGDYVGFDGDIEIALAASTNYITDVAGNDLAEFEIAEFEIDTTPVVEKIVVTDATHITITMSQDLTTNKPTAAGFTIGGADAGAKTVASVAASGKTVVLTIADEVIASSEVITIAYTAGQAVEIQDASTVPNVVESWTAADVTNDL